MTNTPLKTLALTVATSLALVACSSPAENTGAAADLTVAAAFYPLQYVAEAVGGDGVTVTSLTPSGVEPHDIELSPSTVLSLSDTDLVLYIDGFQPAVEDAISTTGVNSFDAASAITLSDADDHSDEAATDDHGSTDPHFWLDPALMAQYAIALGDEFAALDPNNGATYKKNAGDLSTELTDLDSKFTTGLASCERTDIVTAHDAFGYLARAYGLQQEGIAGLEPDTEPSPARLLEIKAIISETGATTIFTEALVSPKVANAVAQDTGVATKVLDPIESVADGDDYPSVMLRNLDNLRNALGCA